MKFNEKESMESHLMKFDELSCALKNAGVKLEDVDLVTHLLLTLPPSFDALISALDNLEIDQLTLDYVKSRLLDHVYSELFTLQ